MFSFGLPLLLFLLLSFLFVFLFHLPLIQILIFRFVFFYFACFSFLFPFCPIIQIHLFLSLLTSRLSVVSFRIFLALFIFSFAITHLFLKFSSYSFPLFSIFFSVLFVIVFLFLFISLFFLFSLLLITVEKQTTI